MTLRDGDRLFAHVWLDPDDPPRAIQLQFNDGGWEHRARWGEPAHGAGRTGGADHRAGDVPEPGRWVRLEVGLPEVGLQPGAELNGWAFTQVGGTVHWDAAGVRTWNVPDETHLDSLIAWERLAAADPDLPAPLTAALAVPRDRRTATQQRAVLRHYLRRVHRGTRALMAPFDERLTTVQSEIRQLENAIPTTLIMRERAEPRQAFVLDRGQYDRPRDRVERATPAMLPPMADDLPRDRLGFARWLTAGDHPLLARVTVNRFWQQVFGTGLVKTSEDFGSQGERPSHPSLLDWLATTFAADWNVRELMFRIVTSATYRQAADASAELTARDPGNRLLARGPRFRLDAEVLRDQALFVSGLLVETLGGPGVKPPQPDGLWKVVAYVGSNTQRFQSDRGRDKVHRRSLYTFFKRTAPPPQFDMLDVPNRESCTVRRERTNTPLQALMLMNDPQYVEAARALGERVLRRPGSDARRIEFAHSLATCRPPSADDARDLLDLLRTQRSVFRADPEAAARLIAVGETKPDPTLDPVDLAAWTVVGNLLLNLDVVVTKG